MITELASDIVNILKDSGIIIQRYDSVTTDSVYLKLDYGVLNSIRISNHNGKSRLKYRYNLRLDCNRSYYNVENAMYIYSLEDVQDMVNTILEDKYYKKKRYGDRYELFMRENLNNNRNKRGFWKDSVIV